MIRKIVEGEAFLFINIQIVCQIGIQLKLINCWERNVEIQEITKVRKPVH